MEGSINAINPQDVESVSVLKDASSSAVYGARGAFGVVLITTKSAKKGTPVINYNGSVTINRRTVTPDVVTDGLTWINWWKDCYNGYYNGSKALLNHVDSTIPYTETIYQELIRRSQDPSLARTTALSGHDQFGWAYYDSTDWHSLFYKDYNWSTEHNLSISGGGDQADYYISGRFYDMDGIYKVGNDSYKKYDVRAKGTLKVRPWLRLTNNMSVSVIDAYEPKHQKNNSQIPRLINHTAMPLSPVKNPRRYVDGRGSQIGLCRLLGGDFVAHERLCLPAQQVRREHRSGEGRADRFGRLLLQLHQSQAHGRPDGDRILEKAGRDSLRVGGCGLQSPKRRIPDALPVGQRLPELVAQAGRRPHVQGARGLEYRETEVRDADDQTRRVRHRFPNRRSD